MHLLGSTDHLQGAGGVVVDKTAVSKVVPETNSLTYRGYAVQDLAEHCSFEQVACCGTVSCPTMCS